MLSFIQIARIHHYLVFLSFSVRDAISSVYRSFCLLSNAYLSHHNFLCLQHTLDQMTFLPGENIKRILIWLSLQTAARCFLPCSAAGKCQELPSFLSSDCIVCGKGTRFLINRIVNPFLFVIYLFFLPFFSFQSRWCMSTYSIWKLSRFWFWLSYVKKRFAFWKE